jgi:hypothetical protein
MSEGSAVTVKFGFDERGLRHAVEESANRAVREIAAKLQRMLDRLGREYEGEPVAVIKPVLQREWRAVNGGSITDPELTVYAQHLSDGTRILIKPGKLRM